MRSLRIALAQINPTVGDLEGNVSKIVDYIRKAQKAGAGIVAFPELAITGYPPEDLLLKTQFIDDNLAALKKVRKNVGDIIAIVGFVDRKDDIYNAAAVLFDKKIIDVYHKIYLPNYGVFDEYRYFQAGDEVSNIRDRRHLDRRKYLRGHLVSRRACADPVACRRRGDHKYQRISLSYQARGNSENTCFRPAPPTIW